MSPHHTQDGKAASALSHPQDTASDEQLAALLKAAQSVLGERERKILEARFGQTQELTLKEIGQCFRVTRERIQSIPVRLSDPTPRVPSLRAFSEKKPSKPPLTPGADAEPPVA